MLLASVNLNKRLGSTVPRANLAAWLRDQGVQLLLAQEPYKPADRTPPMPVGFRFAGGDGHLGAWISEDLDAPSVFSPFTWVQRVELEWLLVLQVHLDAHRSATRTAQLGELARMVDSENGRPLLICGDFNLSPRQEDGLFGDEISTFTTETERTALRRLILSAGLVDTTAHVEPEFTFERVFSGRCSRFRCDLALLSDHMTGSTTVTVDTAVRSGPRDFTDHSALLIDLPVTMPTAEPDDVLFALGELTSGYPHKQEQTVYRPHRTAMSRPSPSPAARAVTRYLIPALKATSVLDHGCGRGADVAHYRALGLDAEGYDPHDGFGWPRPQRRGFDLVTSMFVLNVLPDPWQRIQTLRDAASYVRSGGHVVVVTRSPEEISTFAGANGWSSHHDGFWSSRSRGTFQRGLDTPEIVALARRAGLVPATHAPGMKLPGVCHAVLVKPKVP